MTSIQPAVNSNELLSGATIETTQHTPGVWSLSDDEGFESIAIFNESEELIATVFNADVDAADFDPETRANAQLIAAAPVLLAACEALVEDREECGIDEADEDDPLAIIVRQARAAIAKAMKGEAR